MGEGQGSRNMLLMGRLESRATELAVFKCSGQSGMQDDDEDIPEKASNYSHTFEGPNRLALCQA